MVDLSGSPKFKPNVLDTLLPKTRSLVIDLVQAAGIDTTEWGQYSRGPEFASVNPKFCYEWAFVAPERIVVLNLWHARIKEVAGRVTWSYDLRKAISSFPQNPKGEMWKARAQKLDAAIQIAAKGKLPIRAIINDGTVRFPGDADAKSSKVKFRLLDPIPWAVESYDWATGKCSLVRGAMPNKLIDQFMLPSEPDSPTERRDRKGSEYVRNPAHRRRAILRANGMCEYCSAHGFTTDDGDLFLETHHIIPLSQNGPDSATNVAAICPNHHREAHNGSRRLEIQKVLLEKAKMFSK